jgi:hypothetical protein
MEYINGQTNVDMKVNGWIIKWKEQDTLHGQMVEDMKENISMIRKKVMVYSSGLMGGNMMDNGKMGNNMELESIHQPQENQRRENGTTESVLTGSDPYKYNFIQYCY